MKVGGNEGVSQSVSEWMAECVHGVSELVRARVCYWTRMTATESCTEQKSGRIRA